MTFNSATRYSMNLELRIIYLESEDLDHDDKHKQMAHTMSGKCMCQNCGRVGIQAFYVFP